MVGIKMKVFGTYGIIISAMLSFLFCSEQAYAAPHNKDLRQPQGKHTKYILQSEHHYNEHTIRYTPKMNKVLDPFLGTSIHVDDISPDYSFSAPEYAHSERVSYDYDINAGVTHKLTKGISLSLNPLKNRLSTEFDIFKLKKFKNTKLKFKVNRKKLKATVKYKW